MKDANVYEELLRIHMDMFTVRRTEKKTFCLQLKYIISKTQAQNK